MTKEFIASYIQTALWSSTDDDGNPLDDNYSIDNIDSDSLKRLETMCIEFQDKNKELISQALNVTNLGHIAHYFWLTQNHHGAGFWDGDYPEILGDALTAECHKFEEVNIYVGDDGKLYI